MQRTISPGNELAFKSVRETNKTTKYFSDENGTDEPEDEAALNIRNLFGTLKTVEIFQTS